jgi:hypothetical protein
MRVENQLWLSVQKAMQTEIARVSQQQIKISSRACSSLKKMKAIDGKREENFVQ